MAGLRVAGLMKTKVKLGMGLKGNALVKKLEKLHQELESSLKRVRESLQIAHIPVQFLVGEQHQLVVLVD